jgi:Asp-tRNA(Asn)/Glu-tRNA(Gln) amidotransferase A subunit family amidase
MRFEEYRQHDAVSLAGLIAKRQVSAEEVLEAAIGRAEQVNPAINAIVHKQYEQARAGMPVGLQLIAPAGAEERLVAIGLAAERVLGTAADRLGTPPLLS